MHIFWKTRCYNFTCGFVLFSQTFEFCIWRTFRIYLSNLISDNLRKTTYYERSRLFKVFSLCIWKVCLNHITSTLSLSTTVIIFHHVDINVCGRNEWKHLHGKKTYVLNIIWVVFLFGKFILDVSKSEYYHIMLSYSSILFFRILIYVCFIGNCNTEEN